MNRNITEISWLAGLLEGEGCFTFSKKGTGSVIALCMTDKDVVQKVAKLFGGFNVYEKGRAYPQKTVYSVAIYGNTAIAWMMTLYSFMCKRRQERIKEIIIEWRNKQYSKSSLYRFGRETRYAR